MKQVKILLLAFILLFSVPVFSKTVAITDFSVSSDNPQHKYIGKGISELVSFELAKSTSISVVSREKRTAAIKELSLTMTGLTDPAQQMKVGKMLAARYLISGNIISMGPTMLITMKMVDVQTGTVVWQDKINENLAKYDYISAFFAASALKFLDAQTDASTIAKVKAKKEKNAKAAITFAKAIDSYDKNKKSRARRQLKKAKAIDPENEVVKAYIAKLSTGSPKFKVEVEFYAPSQNPAVLGTIRQDRIYMLFNTSIDKGEDIPEVGSGYRLDDTQHVTVRFGYEFPIGKRWGIGAEFSMGVYDPKVETPYDFTMHTVDGTTYYFHPLSKNYGGILSAGFLATDWLSLGLALHFYHTKETQSGGNGDLYNGINAAFDFGFMLLFLDRRLTIDSHFTLSMHQEYYLLEGVTFNASEQAQHPMLLETTVSGALLNNSLFLVLKQMVDIYTSKDAASSSAERSGYFLRTIPSLEYWIFNFFSLRTAYEFGYAHISGKSETGHGVMAGATLRIWKLDFDFNFTHRYKPSRVLPGYGVDDDRFMISISKYDTFLSR